MKVYAKTAAWFLGLALVLVIGYGALGPYRTVSEVKAAVVEDNPAKLAENVDFDSLRSNLKARFSQSLASQLSGSEESLVAALAFNFTSSVVDGLVDSLVTPRGLAALMEGRNLTLRGKRQFAGSENPQEEDLFQDAEYTYDSLSRFSIWIPSDDGGTTRFVLGPVHTNSVVAVVTKKPPI
jgi:hypothetical protein